MANVHEPIELLGYCEVIRSPLVVRFGLIRPRLVFTNCLVKRPQKASVSHALNSRINLLAREVGLGRRIMQCLHRCPQQAMTLKHPFKGCVNSQLAN